MRLTLLVGFLAATGLAWRPDPPGPLNQLEGVPLGSKEMDELAHRYKDHNGLLADNWKFSHRLGEGMENRVDGIIKWQINFQRSLPLKKKLFTASINAWKEFRKQVPERQIMDIETYKFAVNELLKLFENLIAEGYPHAAELLTQEILFDYVMLNGLLWHICSFDRLPRYLKGNTSDVAFLLIEQLAIDVISNKPNLEWNLVNLSDH